MRAGMLLLVTSVVVVVGAEVETVEELLQGETGLRTAPPAPHGIPAFPAFPVVPVPGEEGGGGAGGPVDLWLGFYIESLGTFRASEMVIPDESGLPAHASPRFDWVRTPPLTPLITPPID